MLWSSFALIIFWAPNLVLGETNEVDVIAFELAPSVSSAQGAKSTWQAYFEQLKLLNLNVYDVCDLLPSVVKNASALYKLALVTCAQQPRDTVPNDATSAILYFDSQHFNQSDIVSGCRQNLAVELQNLLNKHLTGDAQLTVNSQPGFKKLWGYKLMTELITSNTSITDDDLEKPFQDPILKASFQSRNDLFNRWFPEGSVEKPLAIAFMYYEYKYGFSTINYYHAMHFEIHFEVRTEMTQSEFNEALADLEDGAASEGQFPEDTDYIKWIDDWYNLERNTFSKVNLGMISHACTRFEKINATVFHLEGSVLQGGAAAKLNYKDAENATRIQMLNIMRGLKADFAEPLSIQLSDFGRGIYALAEQEIYYNLRNLPADTTESTLKRAVTSMLNETNKAADGFGNDTSITVKAEMCMMSTPPLRQYEYFFKHKVYQNNEDIPEDFPLLETSQEYKDLKAGVTQHVLNAINHWKFRNTVTSIQVGKLVKHRITFLGSKKVLVHIRIIFDAITVAERLMESGLSDEAKYWLKTEFESALENEKQTATVSPILNPSSKIHLGPSWSSTFNDINGSIACGYVYYLPNEDVNTPGNLVTGAPPMAPMIALYPLLTSLSQRDITTTATPMTVTSNPSVRVTPAQALPGKSDVQATMTRKQRFSNTFWQTTTNPTDSAQFSRPVNNQTVTDEINSDTKVLPTTNKPSSTERQKTVEKLPEDANLKLRQVSSKAPNNGDKLKPIPGKAIVSSASTGPASPTKIPRIRVSSTRTSGTSMFVGFYRTESAQSVAHLSILLTVLSTFVTICTSYYI